MTDTDLDALSTANYNLRNDGTLTGLIEGGLLFNRQTGMGTNRSGSSHTRVGGAYLLSESELRSLFRSNWIIRKVCNIPSLDMTKKSIELTIEDGDEDDVSKIMARYRNPIEGVSPFSKRSSYSFDEAKQDAERWARLFGSAYIVLKLNGDEDPAKPLESVKSLDAIAVLDCHSLRPSTMDFNKTEPEFYQLVIDRDEKLGYKNGGLIHESRVLPFYGAIIHPYDQNLGGGQHDSVIQSMWEVFMSHYELKATVKEALNSFSLMTVGINKLTELIAAGKESAVKAHLQEVGLAKSVYRILVTDPDASKTGFEGRNLSGLRENVELFIEELTASADLPYYKIWGTVGRAGLSDSGANEARAYAENTSTAQNSKFKGNDQRIIKMLSQIELGRIPESFEVTYPSIYEPTPEEVLGMEESKARIYQTYSTIPGAVTGQEFRRAIATGQPLENIIDLDENPSGIDTDQLAMMQAAANAEAIAKGNAQPERSDSESFRPPEAVRNAAKRGLRLRREFGRGGTAVGIARARDLANGKAVPLETIGRMVSFFARHEVDKKSADWSNLLKPSNGRIAWDLWGGEPGKAWANRIWKRFRKDEVDEIQEDERNDFSYVKRILKWNGLDMGMEFLPGDRRFNKKMKAGYGHIRKHIGADGEALDVYVSKRFIDDYNDGIEWDGDAIFRITQLSRDDGDFDEYKYIIGVDSEEEAENLYRAHMPNWAFGGVDEVDLDEVRSHRRDAEDDPKTPAKPSEQISGSSTNKEGSASGVRGGIELSDAVVSSLEAKVEAHNKKHSRDSKRATLGMLKSVWRRGAGAYSKTHRPSVSSRQQWAMGRVNAFLRLLATGKPKNASYTTDNDLLPKGHPRSTRNDSEPVDASGRILSAEEWDRLANVSEQDALRILGEALE